MLLANFFIVIIGCVSSSTLFKSTLFFQNNSFSSSLFLRTGRLQPNAETTVWSPSRNRANPTLAFYQPVNLIRPDKTDVSFSGLAFSSNLIRKVVFPVYVKWDKRLCLETSCVSHEAIQELPNGLHKMQIGYGLDRNGKMEKMSKSKASGKWLSRVEAHTWGQLIEAVLQIKTEALTAVTAHLIECKIYFLVLYKYWAHQHLTEQKHDKYDSELMSGGDIRETNEGPEL